MAGLVPGLVPAIHVLIYDRGPRCGLEENYGYYLPKNRIVG